MNEKIKYLEKTKTNNWKYPDHFVSHIDDFTINIPLWINLFDNSGLKGKDDINFLELGTSHGRATVWLIENVLTGKNSFIDTVDVCKGVWYDPIEKTFHLYESPPKNINDLFLIGSPSNLEPYIKNNKCEFHHCDTKNFFFNNKSKNKIYDFIYIDADHKKESVIFDAVNSFQILKPNGIIIFDDYGWGNCKDGIDAFLSCFDHKLNVIYKQWQVVIQKI